MLKFAYTLIAMIICTCLMSQARGIQFNSKLQSSSDIRSAFKQAENNNKRIFLYFHVPNCVGCDILEEEMKNKSVGDLYNKYYQSYQMDASSYGKSTAEYYGVYSFPTLLYVNEHGSLLYSAKGLRDGKSVFDIGKLAIKSRRDIRKEMDKRYKDNPKDTDHLFEYIEYQNVVAQKPGKSDKLMKEYLEQRNTIEDGQWMNLVLDYAFDIESYAYEILIKEKKEFQEYYGEETINTTIWQSLLQKELYGDNYNRVDKIADAFFKSTKKAGYTADNSKVEMFFTNFLFTDDFMDTYKDNRTKKVKSLYGIKAIDANEDLPRNLLLEISVHLVINNQIDSIMKTLNNRLLAKHLKQPHHTLLDMQSIVLYALDKEEEAAQKVVDARELAFATGHKNYKASITQFRKWGFLK